MGSLDQLERLKQLYKEESNSDLVVFNDMATTGSFILLISREMMQEFFKNEVKISKKTAFFKTASLGFIDHGGERAMQKRALFKKFFHQDNLVEMMPKLYHIIERHVNNLEDTYWKAGAKNPQFQKIDFSAKLNDIFADLVDFVLLQHEDSFKINGKRLSSAIVDTLEAMLKPRLSIKNALSYDRLNSWGLQPSTR